jgi:uncharacterized protein YbaR (Trm112 family)
MADEPQAAPQDAAPRGGDEDVRTDPRVLQWLVCPLTKTTLVYDEARQELLSRAARLAYPIRDGIPVMLPEEARELDDDEVRNLGKR